MREILFRGKRPHKDEWVQGHYAALTNPRSADGEPVDHVICEGMANFCTSVRGETVGQYTGQNDREGTKIFEGDIVVGKGIFAPEWMTTVVKFAAGGFVLDCDGKQITVSVCADESTGALVIGNIYDDPQIMGEGDRE